LDSRWLRRLGLPLVATLSLSGCDTASPSPEGEAPALAVVPLPLSAPAFPNARLGLGPPDEWLRLRAGEPLELSLRLTGFEVGVPTSEEGGHGLPRHPEGQYLRIAIDEGLGYRVVELGAPLVVEELSPGWHLVRAFPVRDWHEGVKTPGAFAMKWVFVDGGDSRTAAPLPAEPPSTEPILTYSAPEGRFVGAAADSILLDFHLANVELKPGGTRVRLTLDEGAEILLSEWRPYLITGLSSGEHRVRLVLVDSLGIPLMGGHPSAERTIVVER